jgi:hypothetical protein
VLPLRDIVVFPHMIAPLFVGRKKSILALEGAAAAIELPHPLNAGRRDAGAVVADDSRGLAVGDHEPVELAGHSAEKRSSVPPHTCKPSPLTGGGGDPKSLLSRANVSTP